MLRTLVQSRAPVALALAAATGLWGLRMYPIPRDDVFLGLISESAPGTYRLLAYGYATLWFTTPFWVASFAMSMLAILTQRLHRDRAQHRRLLQPSAQRPGS